MLQESKSMLLRLRERRDADADHAGVDDMTKLSYLNEPEVLYNIARRYALNDIYDAEKYKLGDPSNFHYLNQSKTYELDGVSSAQEYIKKRRSMDVVGISVDDQQSIYRTLAAILHLGNIEFSPGKEHDSSNIRDKKLSFHLQMAANLFRTGA